MALDLSKGGKVNLSKESTSSVFRVGLGWDASPVPGKTFDLDVMALLLKPNKKVKGEEYLIFYKQLSDPQGAVVHTGDNRTGEGAGDDESIVIDTTKIDPEIEEVLLLLNIHAGVKDNQNFGQVRNAYVKLYDSKDGSNVIAKYDLEEEDDASMATQVKFCRIYNQNGDWKFQALGEHAKKTLHATLLEYGLDAGPNDL